jgi:hypothetical protein
MATGLSNVTRDVLIHVFVFFHGEDIKSYFLDMFYL